MHAAVAVALAAAGIGPATPAAAAVTYDPDARTGFVGAGDVRRAFGWTRAELAVRASGVVFDHEFGTADTYVVSCGGPAFRVVHQRDFGRYELIDVVAGGYGITGFRITGARFGISGTSVPPAPGQPCPEQGRGDTITGARLVSTTSRWALAATSGDDRRELLADEGR